MKLDGMRATSGVSIVLPASFAGGGSAVCTRGNSPLALASSGIGPFVSLVAVGNGMISPRSRAKVFAVSRPSRWLVSGVARDGPVAEVDVAAGRSAVFVAGFVGSWAVARGVSTGFVGGVRSNATA